MPSGKSTRKTPSLPYIRRPSRAGLEEASPLAPGSPLTPGPSGRLEPAPTPGQGELLQHAVLPVADLNIEELQADLRDISTAVIHTASGQESDNTEESGSSSLDEVELEDEDDFRYDEEEVSESEHPEVSDLEGSPEDAATEVTPESSQQAGYQGTMAAALRTKLDSLKNDITVKITTVRNFLTKDPATNSSKRQATLHLDHFRNLVKEHKEMAEVLPALAFLPNSLTPSKSNLLCQDQFTLSKSTFTLSK